MLKKISKSLFLAFAAMLLLTSCYSYKTVVGKGPQGNEKISQWNHYLIVGLAPVGVSDPKKMAGTTTDYTVYTRQTFINGFISVLTWGIYSPTTTTIYK